MEAKVVLDISSIVWDESDFNTNAILHYKLASEVILFIQAFENCQNLKLVARVELLSNAMSLFPHKITNRRELFDFKRRTKQFLSNRFRDFVSYDIDSAVVCSQPNICCDYFSPDLKTEIGYLITEIHNNSEKHFFCTFSTRWQDDKNLKTNNGNEKEHHTVIHKNSSPTIEEYYFNNIRSIFEHNSKHDSCKGVYYDIKGEKINPLSCYDERKKDIKIPQELLDNSKKIGSERYSYDTQNKTFVCFKSHSDRKYHGYDLYDEDITDNDLRIVLQKIRKEFQK
jgi:hypothetical protein